MYAALAAAATQIPPIWRAVGTSETRHMPVARAITPPSARVLNPSKSWAAWVVLQAMVRTPIAAMVMPRMERPESARLIVRSFRCNE